jgi:hypothetical protein
MKETLERVAWGEYRTMNKLKIWRLRWIEWTRFAIHISCLYEIVVHVRFKLR